MDFSKILNIATDNKNKALEQVKLRKNLMKSKMKANNVTNDAVKKFLERKEHEKRKEEAREAQRKEDLLSLRAAAKNNRKANAMARRTKDNNFGKVEDKIDETEPVITTKLKTQENLRPVGLKEGPVRTNSVNNIKNSREVTKVSMKTQEIYKPKSILPQKDKMSIADKRFQGKINFPAKKPAKSSMDFNSLMKLAKTKQHEPIKMPEKKKEEENTGRLMTQAEKRRFLEEQARKLGISVIIPNDQDRNAQNTKQNKLESNKKQPIPKPTKPEPHKPNKIAERTIPNNNQMKNANLTNKNSTVTSFKVPDSTRTNRERPPLPTSKALPTLPTRPMTKQFPPRDLKPKLINVPNGRFGSSDRNRQMSRAPLPFRPPYMRALPQYEEEEEMDEEMADFIDDGAMEGVEDYSQHIREIFGYDKRKYSVLDDDDCIESSFSRQMQEESYSSRVGLLEDLEDIKREQEELERQYKSHKKRKL